LYVISDFHAHNNEISIFFSNNEIALESGAVSYRSVIMFKNTYEETAILYLNFLLRQRISKSHFSQNVFSESRALETCLMSNYTGRNWTLQQCNLSIRWQTTKVFSNM